MRRNVTKRMKDYFTASFQLDVDMLDDIYDSDFESVRTDRNGRLITFTRQQLLHKMRQLKEQNFKLPGPDEIDYLGASEYGDHCSLFYRIIKGEEPAVYNFVWQLRDDRYSLVRQFTVEHDLSYLK